MTIRRMIQMLREQSRHPQRRRIMIGIGAIFIGIIVGVATLVLAGPVQFDHPVQRVPIVHAQAVNGDLRVDGCTACHQQPIVNQNCSGCHANQPTTINGVEFPHHKPNAKGPTCVECHGVGKDIRFLKPVAVDHNYCQSCHQLKHA